MTRKHWEQITFFCSE